MNWPIKTQYSIKAGGGCWPTGIAYIQDIWLTDFLSWLMSGCHRNVDSDWLVPITAYWCHLVSIWQCQNCKKWRQNWLHLKVARGKPFSLGDVTHWRTTLKPQLETLTTVLRHCLVDSRFHINDPVFIHVFIEKWREWVEQRINTHLEKEDNNVHWRSCGKLTKFGWQQQQKHLKRSSNKGGV